VADLHEPFRQHVLHEPTKELDAVDGGSPDLGRDGDEVAVTRDDAMVGDPDAMGVAAEVREHVLGATEGALGVDDPALLREPGHQAVEAVGIKKRVEPSEGSTRVEATDLVEHLAPKDGAQNAHGEQEARVRQPLRPVKRRAAGRDDRVHVGVEPQVTRPGVEHHGEPEVGAEARDAEFEKRLGCGGEECSEDLLASEGGEPVQDVRHGEDDMEVPDWKDSLGALVDPRALRCALALGAVPIATRVIRGLRESAAVADVEMSAERRGAAGRDGSKHLGLLGGESALAPERRAEVPDDVGDLEGGARDGKNRRAAHGCALPHSVLPLGQSVERAHRLRE